MRDSSMTLQGWPFSILSLSTRKSRLYTWKRVRYRMARWPAASMSTTLLTLMRITIIISMRSLSPPKLAMLTSWSRWILQISSQRRRITTIFQRKSSQLSPLKWLQTWSMPTYSRQGRLQTLLSESIPSTSACTRRRTHLAHLASLSRRLIRSPQSSCLTGRTWLARWSPMRLSTTTLKQVGTCRSTCH